MTRSEKVALMAASVAKLATLRTEDERQEDLKAAAPALKFFDVRLGRDVWLSRSEATALGYVVE